MNTHLVARLAGIQHALMALHHGGLGLPSAVIGNERETFLREFLQKVFPSHFRFTSGAITDFEGKLTGQVDIAIEYPFLPSFPMPGSSDRLLIAESILAVVEVKSNLVSQWNQVIETVRKVKELTRELNPLMRFGAPPPKKIPCIAVGYTGYTTTEGLRQRLQSTPEECRPDGALVIESGCFDGFGLTANGPVGLYALCCVITQVASQLQAAAPNMLVYVIPPELNTAVLGTPR